jgi:cell division protein FtsB
MSREQKEKIMKGFDSLLRLLNIGVIGFCVWFLKDTYSDFKNALKDVETVKREVTEVKTKVEYIEKYGLKR